MAEMIIIRQIRGLAGKPRWKRVIVRSTLGLRKIGHEVCRHDIPSVRGAIRKVPELVVIVGKIAQSDHAGKIALERALPEF